MDEVYIDIRKENAWIKKYFENKDLVSIGDLISVIEDLEEDLRENYRPIPYAEQVCVSDRDFI